MANIDNTDLLDNDLIITEENMDAIIYTSNTGYTKEYAELLSKTICIPAVSIDEAKDYIHSGAEIIYMGWLMAGNIKGYKKAKKKYLIQAVVGVGIADPVFQRDFVIKSNSIGDSMPLFLLQGGFDMGRLKGFYRFMMKVASAKMQKGLLQKTDKSSGDEIALKLICNGGSAVKQENLSKIIEWYRQRN